MLDVVGELLEFDCIMLEGFDLIESILDPDLSRYEQEAMGAEPKNSDGLSAISIEIRSQSSVGDHRIYAGLEGPRIF